MTYRIEKDTLGEMRVESDKLWGAQTQRAMENFVIGKKRMPIEIIYGIATAKKAAACANCDLGVLPEDKRNLIVQACDEILAGKWDEQFPLHIWQTGSGTQTNINVFATVGNFTLHPDGSEVTEGRFWSFADIDAATGKKILTPNFEGEFKQFRSALQALL